MITVEIYDNDDKMIRMCDLPFMPIVGGYVTIEQDGYFIYYNVVEVWIRIPESGSSAACMRVQVDD